MAKTKTTSKIAFKEQAKKVLNIALDIIKVAVLVAVSFCIGYFERDLEAVFKAKETNFGQVRTYENTSVSVTDRNELMIIDRNTQQIEVYDDTIGLLIFNAYSNILTKPVTE